MVTTTIKTDKLVILQLDDKEADWLKGLFDQERANLGLIKQLASDNEKIKERAWTAISERFPETKDKKASFNCKEKQITCVVNDE